MAMSFFVSPFFEWLCKRYSWNKSWEVKWLGPINVAAIASFVFGITTIVIWLIMRTNDHFFFLTDALAFALAVTSLSSVRLPNLKVSSIILVLFFLYDIFWVFISQYIFKQNVMITVAVGLPNLPMVLIFPRMLDDGISLLGLGDIVLPGLFLCFLYRFDHFNKISFKSGYFLRGWIAYALGLELTFVMVYVLDRGQPALLYLVPFTLLTTIFFGWMRGQLGDLWKGLYRVEEIDIEENIPNSDELNGTELKEDQVSLLRAQDNDE